MRPATGAGALAEIAMRWPDAPPRSALRALFVRHNGNASRAAGEIRVDVRVLLAAVNALGERSWLESQFPARQQGGRPVRAPALDVYELSPITSHLKLHT